MSNQYFTRHPDLKNSSPAAPAKTKGVEPPSMKESAKRWPAPPSGGKGRNFNAKVGFPEVKVYVSKK